MKLLNKAGWVTASLLASTALAAANETPVEAPALKNSPQLPVQIIVSRKDQKLKVYRGTEVIASTKVSTGKKGHTTPTGVFSILEKRREHYSNLYNSAPMPYMQRLTWSGIALHESKSVPNYPASHGCVRLPSGFAKKLFGLTKRGAHVVIANRDAVPTPIQHDTLIQPYDAALAGKYASLGAPSGSVPGYQTLPSDPQDESDLMLLASKPAKDPISSKVFKQVQSLEQANLRGKPLRILITHAHSGSVVKEIQKVLNELGFDAGAVDGQAGRGTKAAIKRFVEAKKGSLEDRSFRWSGKVDHALLQELYKTSGKGEVPNGRLYVRRNFKPLFQAPVHISEKGALLGAHLFTANASLNDESKLEWLSVSLADKLTQPQQARLGLAQDEEGTGIIEAKAALDRIEIPDYVRNKLSQMITSGSSLTISDKGKSFETGNGTDFIILTRPDLKAPKYRATSPKKKVAKKKPAADNKKLAKKAERKRVANGGLFGRIFGRRNGS